MTARRRKTWRLVPVAVVAIALFGLYSMGGKAMAWYKVEELTKQMRTVCVGRFLVDLPAGMDFTYSHTFINGFWVETFREDAEAFAARLAARETEINAALNERGKKNMEKVDLVEGGELNGKIFKFGRTTVESEEDEQTIHYVNVALEGYVHSQNLTFALTAEAINPDRTAVLRKIIDQLRVVPGGEVPETPGFCFGAGMFAEPVPVEWTEGVTMFAGFRELPDLALSLRTRAGLGNPLKEPGLLARNETADAELPLWFRALLKKLRIGPRNINGIDGEEVLERGTERNFTNVYAFDWEVIGTKDNVLLPDIHLEMSTGHPANAGAPPVPTFLGDESLVQLWDKISSSIRLRPTRPMPAVTQGPLSESQNVGR